MFCKYRSFLVPVVTLLVTAGLCTGLFAAEKNEKAKMGPETGIGGGVIVSYTDNLGLSEFNEEGDWAIYPYLDFNFVMPMSFSSSRQVDFTLDGNVGAKYYLNEHTLQAGLNGTAGVGFDFMVGNWKMNLHDRFTRSLTADHEEQPWVTGTSEFVYWRNMLGLNASYEFNRLKFTTGYDYSWYRVEKSEFNNYKNTNRDVQTYFVDLAFAANPQTDIFTRWTHEDNTNIRNFYNDSYSNRYELGLRGQLAPLLTGEISAGYENLEFDQGAAVISDNSDYDGWTYKASLHHILSNITAQNLSVSYKPDYGYATGNFYKYFSAVYSLNHNFCQKLLGTFYLGFDHLAESGVTTQSEEADRNLAGFGVTYLLTPRTNLTFNYDYTHRDSDRHGKSYVVNDVSVGLRHQF